MTDAHPGGRPSPLPLLLALPRGAVVGVPLGARDDTSRLASSLVAFGPVVRTDADLKHAVRRPPARLSLDARALSRPHLEAALPVLRRGLAVVVVSSDDLGVLARCCDRILRREGHAFAWVAATVFRGGRSLELRVAGAGMNDDRWIQIPLRDREGSEAVLSAVRAAGTTVCESRIAYRRAGMR